VNHSVPLSLYVHIPWCERKCPYCDFNSHENFNPALEQPYVTALLNDLEQQLDWVQGREITSIFFGGGTPSLFSAKAIASILDGITHRLSLSESCEITLESNPGSAEASKYSSYRTAGVNRLSIGIQSFEDDKLEGLGRVHSANEAIRAVEMAHEAQFKRVNVDLMYGLPHQNPANALSDVQIALSLGVEHISWYQLTIERNTAFWSSPPKLPSEELIEPMQSQVARLMAEKAMTQYEVSAWSKKGQEARHNLNYWRFGDYLAIGAGAHGKVTLSNEVFRFQRTRQPQHYIGQFSDPSGTASSPELNPIVSVDLAGEFMMNALRLKHGVLDSVFEARTGQSVEIIAAKRAALVKLGLMDADSTRLRATDLGYRHLDSLIERFI